MVAVIFMSVLRAAAVNGQDLDADTRALLVFGSVHDPRGTKLKWSNATATCTWKGITCVENRVQEVRLPGKGFRGDIPPGSLGLLTELRVVSLRNNKLTGMIPGELAGCNKLQALYLANNQFSGPVLSLTGLWPQLQRLSLDNNRSRFLSIYLDFSRFVPMFRLFFAMLAMLYFSAMFALLFDLDLIVDFLRGIRLRPPASPTFPHIPQHLPPVKVFFKEAMCTNVLL